MQGAYLALTPNCQANPGKRDSSIYGAEIAGAGEGIRTLDPNLGKVVL